MKIKSLIYEIIQIVLAILLASIGLKAFLLPNGFLDGGVTGIAILLSNVFNLDISFLLILISIPFFILGWFSVSKRILVKSVLAVLTLALIIHFENFDALTDDKLIIATFGGIFLGAGIGLAIKNGCVLDGSEIFGIFVHERWGFSIGSIILVFNIVLFGITALVISVEVALYSILTYIVTGKVIDLMIQGFEDYVGLMIISRYSDELQQMLMKQIGHGLTVYDGLKGYGSRGTRENMEIIHIVINRIDFKRVYRIIDEIDHDAFVIEFDVNSVRGGVLKQYLSQNSKKELHPDVVKTIKK